MKYLSLIILTVGASLTISAQAYTNTVMGLGGVFGEGYGGQLTYNVNLNEVSFTQIALHVNIDQIISGEVGIPYSSFAGSYSFFTTLISTGRRKQVISVGAGPLVGYELVNNGETDLSNIVSLTGESKFIYGGVGAIELDIIVSEHLSLVLKSSQFYHANSDFGKFTNLSGAGIRYYFNK